MATDARVSRSAGDEELYFAVVAPLGFARVAISTAAAEETIARARREVFVAGGIGAIAAMLLSLFFARAVSRPVVELREVAQEIAAGDLTRRPTLAAPGEIGDLAMALHRMTEQLASRLAALEAEDLLLGAVIDSLNEAVVAVDARRQVVRVNEPGGVSSASATSSPFRPITCRAMRRCATRSSAALVGRASTPSSSSSKDARWR